MKTTLTIRHLEDNEVVRGHFEDKALRIQKHLKRFKDDLTCLHGVIEKNPHKEEVFSSLSLYLPTVVLHCRERGDDFLKALNLSFLVLGRQIEKHKAKITREKRRKER